MWRSYKMIFTIEIKDRNGITDKEIDKLVDFMEDVNYDDIRVLCDGGRIETSFLKFELK